MRRAQTGSVILCSAIFLLVIDTSELLISRCQAFASEAQQMCMEDAFRLCSSAIPNIPEITACMRKHRTELSAGCLEVMDNDRRTTSTGRTASDRDGVARR